ncbi:MULTISPECIES: branched-chain amino acid transport system II carrier protein [unclassified Gemella]|uniref:branched-chain amino acid transport system II carrier protein n=1 Tax=unclassified Gemella TaxID=2624949 RepID=UPI0010749840|nr:MULTISPECIES: branched-chain amino acid transport system II carrier protein [unclassified Gemella]MBF0710493.1 branched-chain amino acid transport system II carrier protein [Gemella sp. GL1.1]MBF0746566.1 branched-chain amino acid transport system II carrier protein [Gemella sp. 19428wG2_WT2a]NYS27837.1 branched-chain amino acid transport system II carrier protein [Gemella sp. GL1]TFU59926.1 branched-chain amino acid transport system II carrier protein [Gemella sp. WT2a]
MSKLFKSPYLAVGLMLFALFFGAGNLIFPAFLGAYSGSNVWLAILGFCITGVTLPLLGIAAVARSGKSDVAEFAGQVSKKYGMFFAVALYLAIGPLFAIPRTGATSYDIGVAPLFGESQAVKVAYAALFFGLTYFLAVNPGKVVDRVGKILTPALIAVIVVLVAASFVKGGANYGEVLNAGKGAGNAFVEAPFVAGLIQGYGTMDALASLAFAIIVVNAVKAVGLKKNSEVAAATLKSGLIAVVLLALVYVFVARIGAISQHLFTVQDGALMYADKAVESGGIVLALTSEYFLGSFGQAVLAAVVILACLTTSTGLVIACSEYFNKLLPSVSYKVWAPVFTAVSTLLYFGGLSEIIKWSVPVLMLLYPLTVVLIALTFVTKKKPVFVFTTLLTVVPALYDGISTFAAMTKWFTVSESVANFFANLPLGAYSLSWLVFSLAGFVLGHVYAAFKK